MIRDRCLLASVVLVWLVPDAGAQPLGTFRWQLRPFCNVVTVAITQNGAVYRLEGTDDQCGGGADAASVTGTAFPNADGTIGFGLNIVTTPGGRPLHVDAEITLGAFSGTWRDSAGAAGTFVLTPGAGSGGAPRPLPSSIALRPDGGFVATGTAGQSAIPASGPGVRMMWYPGKAAFRAGRADGPDWDDPNVGFGSVALGDGTAASGEGSTALGHSTAASGGGSTALGFGTTASGVFSTALGGGTTASGSTSLAAGSSTVASGPTSLAAGSSTVASGPTSLAVGSSTVASGSSAVAMGSSTAASGANALAAGSQTTASGSASTALGSSTLASGSSALAAGTSSVANGAASIAFGNNGRADGASSVALGNFALAAGNGSFVFADRAQFGVLYGALLPNQFMVRATGGVEFHTNQAATLGVRLASNGNQWLTLSDVRTKHRFRELDDDDLLAKIAAMPVTEWSYREQDAAVRHIGPTAQDFHAAFGLGEDPLRIGTLDADGVALAGVKAVAARTRALRDEHEALRQRVAALEQALAAALDLVRTQQGGR